MAVTSKFVITFIRLRVGIGKKCVTKNVTGLPLESQNPFYFFRILLVLGTTFVK